MKKPGAAIIFLICLVIFLALLAPKLTQVHKLEERSRDLDEKIKKIKLENLRLENELRLLREDPVYLEKIAREKFNKAREGEIVYKVVREGQPAAQKD